MGGKFTISALWPGFLTHSVKWELNTIVTGNLPINYINSTPIKSFSYKLPVASAQVKSSILLAGLCRSRDRDNRANGYGDHTERSLSFGCKD